jgi:hypothetical protein
MTFFYSAYYGLGRYGLSEYGVIIPQEGVLDVELIVSTPDNAPIAYADELIDASGEAIDSTPIPTQYL